MMYTSLPRTANGTRQRAHRVDAVQQSGIPRHKSKPNQANMAGNQPSCTKISPFSCTLTLTSPSGKRPTVTLPRGLPMCVAISAARSGLALPEKIVIVSYSGLYLDSQDATAAVAPTTPKRAAADKAAPVLELAPPPPPWEVAAAHIPEELHLPAATAHRDTVALARESITLCARVRALCLSKQDPPKLLLWADPGLALSPRAHFCPYPDQTSSNKQQTTPYLAGWQAQQ